MLGIGAPGCNIINHWNLYHFWMDHKKHHQTIAKQLSCMCATKRKDFPKPVGNIPSFPASRYGTHLGWDSYWSTSQKKLFNITPISQTGANFPLAWRVLYMVVTYNQSESSSIPKLYRACTNIGWAGENFAGHINFQNHMPDGHVMGLMSSPA